MNAYTQLIAKDLQLPERGVDNTLELLEQGCTIPFISRYRKERTGGLNEVQIAQISQLNDNYKTVSKRKETILKTIEEQGKLTDELKSRIDECWDNAILEDIYLPYKPKRRTKAQVARERGLEPLAQIIMLQQELKPKEIAKKFVSKDVPTAEDAITGAKDIIAETINEDERSRIQLRNTFEREATSDLTGERGSLMGAIQGLLLAQYEVLREHGHSPSEAFNETVEELTQSLGPLFGAKGMDWMYANCSTTAQEAQITIDANSKPDYRAGLEKELEAMRNQEMWRAGETVRKLRPENQDV